VSIEPNPTESTNIEPGNSEPGSDESDSDEQCDKEIVEQFEQQIDEQIGVIKSLYKEKSYAEAETAIESFISSLPQEVISSTDFQSLFDACLDFVLVTACPDVEKGYMFTEESPEVLLVSKIFFSYLEVQNLKINLLITEGKFEDSINLGKKLLDLIPTSNFMDMVFDEIRAGTFSNIGLAYSKWGKLDEAFSCYEQASAITPSNETVWLNKGIVTSKRALRDDSPELFEQALTYFKDTLNINPVSSGAQVGMVFIKELMIKPREFRDKLIQNEEEILEGGKNVIIESNEYLKKILKDMRTGLNISMIMFIIQFFVGLFLIFLSIWMLMNGFAAEFDALIGASGVLISILALYISAPMKIQRNRVDLAQWNIIFSNWTNAMYLTNSLIAQKIRRGENSLTFTDEVNTYLQNSTNFTVDLIKKHLEEKTE